MPAATAQTKIHFGGPDREEAKRRKGSRVHIAVDTVRQLLALQVTAADKDDRAQLVEQVQEVTGNSVKLAYVDQGYTGLTAAQAAQEHGIRLEMVKRPCPNAASCSYLAAGWLSAASARPRFRHLARNYEGLAFTLKGLHLLAILMLMLRNLAKTYVEI